MNGHHKMTAAEDPRLAAQEEIHRERWERGIHEDALPPMRVGRRRRLVQSQHECNRDGRDDHHRHRLVEPLVVGRCDGRSAAEFSDHLFRLVDAVALQHHERPQQHEERLHLAERAEQIVGVLDVGRQIRDQR